MKSVYMKVWGVLAVVVFLFSFVPLGAPQQTEHVVSLRLLNEPEGDQTYQLNITIPQSLVNHYAAQSHTLFTPNDFPKYVTPYALKPVADSLWQIYDTKEEFANGVLMLVHQITYKETAAGKYPVETLAEGQGDCDLFVYIAASILKAGGIDAVLIYYKEQKHMEIGIDIGGEPQQARVDTFCVEYQNVSYYISECTGIQWRDGWRVGECPSEFQNKTVQVIPLPYSQDVRVGQVSVTLKELEPSTLTLQPSSSILLEGTSLTVRGQILPKNSGENVTIQAKTGGGGYTTVGSVLTDADGKFEYTWTPQTGSVTVQASWLGNKIYNGAKTEAAVTVVPLYLLALIVTAIAATGVVSFTYVVTRRRKHDTQQPMQPPEPSQPPTPNPEAPS
jgi:hypothetical protein